MTERLFNQLLREEENFQKPIKKIFIFGENGTGKSAIVQKLIGHHHPTTPSKMEESHWKVYQVGRESHVLNIVDTGSFSSPLAIRRMCHDKDCAFVLVYSLNDERSFETVERIQSQIKNYRFGKALPPIIIVCNKVDTMSSKNRKPPHVVITQELMVKMDWEMDFVALSAKTGFGISVLAQVVLQRLFNMEFHGECSSEILTHTPWAMQKAINLIMSTCVKEDYSG